MCHTQHQAEATAGGDLFTPHSSNVRSNRTPASTTSRAGAMRRQSVESSLTTPASSKIAARNKDETEEASPMQVIFLAFACMLLSFHHTQQLRAMRRERNDVRSNNASLQTELEKYREQVNALQSQGSSLHSQFSVSETTKSVTNKVRYMPPCLSCHHHHGCYSRDCC